MPTLRRLLVRAAQPAVAAVLLLFAPGASALSVYGPARALPGAGGCLRDGAAAASADCPGRVAGLGGARALLLSGDGRNLYVAAPESSAVVTLARARSGALTAALLPSARACVAALAGGPCARRDAALSGVDALAISPDGRFVYAGARDSATVSAYTRGRGGVLVGLPRRLASARGAHGGHRRPQFGCVQGRPVPGVPDPRCAARQSALSGVDALVVSPDGRNLYAVSFGTQPGEDSIVALARDPASGALSPLASGGCVQSQPARLCRASAGALEGAASVAVSPDGRFVYVASHVSGAVVAFARNRRRGTLRALTAPGGCASDDAQQRPGGSCALTVPGLSGAQAVTLSPDGRELYVAAFDPGAVVGLARDPVSGLLAPLAGAPLCLQVVIEPPCAQGVPALRGASSLALTASGHALYVASEGANTLVELLRDPASGRLVQATANAAPMPALNGPQTLATAPRGRGLYLASPFEDGVLALEG